MAKKVLVFSSSPRKGGNSDLLCDQFISGSKEAGHATEKIFLKEKKINYCTGCGTCIDKGKSCPQKDDMSGILEKMISESTVDLRLNTRFKSIGDGNILLAKGNTSEEIPCDDVLMAVGMKPENSLENHLDGKIDRLFVIGDCEKPRKIWDAVHEGFHVARVLE